MSAGMAVECHVWTAPGWQGEFFTSQAWSVQPCVRPVCAVHMTAATVKVQAKGHCRTRRLWTYVRDDQPFGGLDPPAAAFFYSPDRAGKRPEDSIWRAMPG